MLSSPAGAGVPSQRGLWTSAPIPSATGFTDGFSKYGVYSLFPGGPTFGSAIYPHANAFGRFTSGQFQPTGGNIFHGSGHKVSDSLFSTGYTFGAPTPPPGSPYSPIPVTQLELLTKGINSNIIIQSSDFSLNPKKVQITEKRCDEKCCNIKEKSCHCQVDESSMNIKGKFSENNLGCSRTNPIEWGNINVKKEPCHPCQVAEITTSLPPVIKLEVTSPTQKNGEKDVNTIMNGNIPMGIAVARQRTQQPDLINSPSLPPTGLLTTVNCTNQIKEIAKYSEIESAQVGMAASMTAGGAMGGAILQCPDERSTTLASWPIGGTQNSSLTTPTLWQYPEPIQQTVVWPSYTQPSPLLLPPLPPPPLQLLSSATSDYLSSSATFHQQTQTHSTRLVALTTDTKRKLPLPSTTLIKIEADASTLDQSKTISTMSSTAGTVFSDPNLTPLLTTHVFYQHPPNLILSQPSTLDMSCKSQEVATPLPCLTPPPEITTQSDEPPLGVDASNQTDTPICSEDDTTSHTLPEEITENTSNNKSLEVKTIESEPSPRKISILKEIQTLKVEEKEVEVKELKKIKTSEICVGVENKPTPDLSGLELLSNSIVEFESCRNNLKSEESQLNNPSREISYDDQMNCNKCDEEIKKEEKHNENKSVDDCLGGLNLLCALAEQRILEESSEGNIKVKNVSKKKKSKHHFDEPVYKKRRSDKNSDEDRYNVSLDLTKRSEQKGSASESNSGDIEGDIKCLCRGENCDLSEPPTIDEEFRHYISKKTQSNNCCQTNWPSKELNMRIKLADLRRRYREKRKQLNKLSRKKRHHHHHHHHHSKCSKKRSKKSRSKSSSPIRESSEKDQYTIKRNDELLKPATLCAIENLKMSKHSKLKNSHTETEEIIEKNDDDEIWSIKRKYSTEITEDYQEKEKKSSSKKRKVGRPKKISEKYIPTETIVAKKPKTGNFVGYLMAAKEKLQMRRSLSDSPPRFIDDTTVFTENKNNNINNNNNSVKDSHCDNWTNKIYNSNNKDEKESDEEDIYCSTTSIGISDKENMEDEIIKENKEKHHVCTLTSSHLEIENLRVLTAMGGLFYAGQLHAVEPPDVYSITLDGERGNRPHIMSREEILRDAIVEISPKSTDDLEIGVRLCAYWSQQYRCLYPGTVAEPGTPNSKLDSKFVAVEFDDGDSGTIAIEDIRLLPTNYPVVEYDPNPLLSLSKRKRRASSSATGVTENRQNLLNSQEQPKITTTLQEIKEKSQQDETYKEHKRLKKKKKEKTKIKEDLVLKKKKKKHRSSEEKCKHKKHHKKRRKHKKHHHNKDENYVISNEKTETKEYEPEEEDAELSSNSVSIKDFNMEDEVNEITSVDDNTKDFFPTNPEDEVTMDDILEVLPKSKKIRDRQASCESSRSKMSAFLPLQQLWSWSGKGYKRPRGKGRTKKQFYKSIQRGKESISVGDSAVFKSTGRPDRPYIGHIEAMWEQCGTMVVRVKWFYHPEETFGCPENLKYPGALFESQHSDENDVQTISHKCEVLPLNQYIETLGNDPKRFASIYKNNDIYYLAGYYDPTGKNLKMEDGIPSIDPE